MYAYTLFRLINFAFKDKRDPVLPWDAVLAPFALVIAL